MTQHNKLERQTNNQPPHHQWDWRTTLYLLIGVALCLWAPIQMAIQWEILPELTIPFALGLAFLLVTWRTVRSNREAKHR